MRNLKLAAVDIGSNAIRIQVTNVIHYQDNTTYKKLEYVRFPLRLGQDVFNQADENALPMISPERAAKFLKLMHAFKLLIELYEVDDYMGCATSAMREAMNGPELVEKAREEYGLELNIISGKEEAEMLNKALEGVMDEKSYLHIDVGGGSTELNVYVNREKIASESFPIGSVRRLVKRKSLENVWKEMRIWIKTHAVKKEYGKITAIGTGGNIGKILEIAKKKQVKILAIHKIRQVQKFIASHSWEERINKLQLNPDRADVIIPASEIYISVMDWAEATKIIVPDVGLKDGIMHMLHERNLPKLHALEGVENVNS
jgi:exopolyphosphatase / guanosine-5'-triphosphate,3'-diphosphate pyrophosphatase